MVDRRRQTAHRISIQASDHTLTAPTAADLPRAIHAVDRRRARTE